MKVLRWLLIFLIFTSILHAEEPKPVPYSKQEFPEAVLDIRRAEIITLGSLPFTTLLTTFSYSFYRYFNHGCDSSYAPNPFAKTSEAANLNTSEQKLIIGVASGISLGIGITDLCFNHHAKKRKTIEKQKSSSNIIIEGLEDDENNDFLTENEYLYGGLQSVLF